MCSSSFSALNELVMAFNAQEYKIEDEVMHKGVLYIPTMFHDPETRAKVEQWRGHPSDLIIASYPKSGKVLCCNLAVYVVVVVASFVFFKDK